MDTKRCLISLATGRWNKNQMKDHFMSTRMIRIKKRTSIDDGVENWNLIHSWWTCKMIQPLWKIMWSFLKRWNIVTTLSVISTPRYAHKTCKHFCCQMLWSWKKQIIDSIYKVIQLRCIQTLYTLRYWHPQKEDGIWYKELFSSIWF